MESNRRSVCIVGAGAAGMVALKNFIINGEQFGEIVCYEQTKFVGGTWNYVEKTGLDENGLPIHSSMYKSLRTNLPKQIMEYPDFELKSDSCFMQHEVVLKYLNDYCEHFRLRDYIQFESVVRKIVREKDHWKVTIQNFAKQTTIDKQFDIVVLCHGHYSTPLYCDCNGIEQFKGAIVHSHDYRTPDKHKGQTILVIGAGFSGIDIALELAEVSDQVYLLDRKAKPWFKELGKVKLINGSSVGFGERSAEIKMMDSEETRVLDGIDTVFVCTGYRMNFDILDPSCGISVNPNNTVNGFYRHVINILHPTMACIGITSHVPPSKMFHIQVLFYLQYLLGKFKLPSREEMEKREEEDMKLKLEHGQRPKDRHRFTLELVQKYFRDLEEEAGLGMIIKPVTIEIYRDIQHNMRVIPLDFKKVNYRVINDHQFEKYIDI